MRYELDRLETSRSLQIAKELSEITVNEPFVFHANMKWVRPFGMLFSALSMKQFRKKHSGFEFNMEIASNKSAIDYAAHMGFFQLISEKINIGNMPGEARGNNNYIPITELDFEQIQRVEIEKGNYIGLGDTIENESSRLAKILSRENVEMHALLTYLIREILRNIPEHADSNKAWICGQYWADGSTEIAIVDEGIGIRNSLRKNNIHQRYIETDSDALECAVKAGISQAFQPARQNKSEDIWSNSGFGLYMVSEICKKLNGSFVLVSGEKYLHIQSDNEVSIINTSFCGTAVKITISTQEITNSKQIISEIAGLGEQQAKTIRNAFKKASLPSKGLISNLQLPQNIR